MVPVYDPRSYLPYEGEKVLVYVRGVFHLPIMPPLFISFYSDGTFYGETLDSEMNPDAYWNTDDIKYWIPLSTLERAVLKKIDFSEEMEGCSAT